MSSEITRKIKQIELLERKKELREGLPHLHGFKLYKWQKEFINAHNKVALLCAGNQIGKSSANILKWIHWATEPSLWPKLWPNRRPQQFWCLMPTKDMITTEFRSKWETEFLPRGEFKKRGQYAWEVEMRNRHVWAIHFTGTKISVYIHTYEQDVHHLQAGTVDAMFVDEEPPWDLMPELLMRLAATNGYLNAVMTPTKGQDPWRRAFEIRGDDEIFTEAFKRRVSVFDCLKYDDGTESNWTLERINQMMNRLSTQQEIDLRIYGKFVAQEGLRVPSFDRERNVKHNINVDSGWLNYVGIDIGSGGQAHPPAIVFVAVKPDYQKGYVTKVWKGDKSRNYTVTDIIEQFMQMRGNLQMTGQYYDYASAEFGLVSTRAGLGFEKAEKSHDIGFPLINALFKNQMLDIIANDGYQALVNELLTLRVDGKKLNDDAIDAFRYAIAAIPWNFDSVTGTHQIQEKKSSKMPDERLLRPNVFTEGNQADIWDPSSDIKEFNDLMGFNDDSTSYDW
jgi:phage terminase large subunit-like protein